MFDTLTMPTLLKHDLDPQLWHTSLFSLSTFTHSQLLCLCPSFSISHDLNEGLGPWLLPFLAYAPLSFISHWNMICISWLSWIEKAQPGLVMSPYLLYWLSSSLFIQLSKHWVPSFPHWYWKATSQDWLWWLHSLLLEGYLDWAMFTNHLFHQLTNLWRHLLTARLSFHWMHGSELCWTMLNFVYILYWTLSTAWTSKVLCLAVWL